MTAQLSGTRKAAKRPPDPQAAFSITEVENDCQFRGDLEIISLFLKKLRIELPENENGQQNYLRLVRCPGALIWRGEFDLSGHNRRGIRGIISSGARDARAGSGGNLHRPDVSLVRIQL